MDSESKEKYNIPLCEIPWCPLCLGGSIIFLSFQGRVSIFLSTG
jgi:hypothetical protein